jgi:hypothetical protein
MSLDTQDWTSGKYSFVYSVENLCVTQESWFNIRLTGQNNGNSCERYTFLYQYGVVPPFACNTAYILLGIDSYTFWIVSSGILYYLYWRTSSSYLSGGVNLLLTLLSKSGHSGSMIFKDGDYAGQGRCWSASSCFSNQYCALLAVCMDELLSRKFASFLGEKFGSYDAPCSSWK